MVFTSLNEVQFALIRYACNILEDVTIITVGLEVGEILYTVLVTIEINIVQVLYQVLYT